ncbi:MAG: hypothetical protein ACTHOP_06370 [Mesorhizobium sp.]
MSFIVAALAAFIAFVVVGIVLAFGQGLLVGGLLGPFRLLRVEPYRTAATLGRIILSLWAAWTAFFYFYA